MAARRLAAPVELLAALRLAALVLVSWARGQLAVLAGLQALALALLHQAALASGLGRPVRKRPVGDRLRDRGRPATPSRKALMPRVADLPPGRVARLRRIRRSRR